VIFSLPSSYREAAIEAGLCTSNRPRRDVERIVDVVVPVILEGLRAELLSDEAIERARALYTRESFGSPPRRRSDDLWRETIRAALRDGETP
jgi:hypothetical protein